MNQLWMPYTHTFNIPASTKMTINYEKMINWKHTRRIFWPRSFIYYTRFFSCWSSSSLSLSLILIMMMMFVAKKRKQPKYCHFVYGCDKNFEWVFCFVLVTIFVEDEHSDDFREKKPPKISIFFSLFWLKFIWLLPFFFWKISKNFQNFHLKSA